MAKKRRKNEPNEELDVLNVPSAEELPPEDEDEYSDYDEAEVANAVQRTIDMAEGDFLQRNGINVPVAEARPKRHINVIGVEQINQALQTLKDYKKGKSNFDQRVIDNEEWWKLRHWDKIRKTAQSTEPTSAWLFNSIMNKLADYSDNFPEPNIRARTAKDVEEAERIKNILPMIFESNDYEKTYMDTSLSKIKNGTSITGVFWNKMKDDIDIQPIDVLSIYWQPGVRDIQASRNIFTVELVDDDVLKEMYPDKDIKSGNEVTSAEYLYEDKPDKTNKSAVVDWYYKRKGKLHYCKFVNGTVLFATENEPDEYPNGLYDDGNYPFVIDTLFKMEGTIAGFGYLDVCKSPQEYIDRLDQAIIQNALMCARPRYFRRNEASINDAEFLDWTKPLVTTSGNLGEDDLRQIVVKQLDAGVYNARDGKIQELKQTSGNADVNTGTASSGVTAASAISQLIETGSKGSRHTIKGTYRAYRQIVYLCIERMRQFYDEPRYVRIIGDDGEETFDTYDNSGLVEQTEISEATGQEYNRLPQFDIEVSAQKSSPYNKMNQNELALQFYNYGFFAPQNADMSLACLNMMDFDHKEDIINQVQQNGTLYDILMQVQQENQQLKFLVDQAYPNANLTGMKSQGIQQPTASGQPTPTQEEVQSALGKTTNSLNDGDGTNSRAEQMRRQAADSTEI